MKARLAWLCLPLVIGLAVTGCKSSNSSSVAIAISPSAATVLLGTSVQFIPSVTGSSNAITWSVANGNATFGTISSSGLYTAPATRPVSASGVAVPVIFAMANAAVPGSGSPGSVIELQSGFDFTNFAPGNTINIAGNSVAGWNGSFFIVAVAALQNGNFGVQIANPAGPPANGLGGTATATPNITITAQVQSTSAIASATVTLDSGIRVAFTQPTCMIGTNETFDFSSFVTVSGTSDQRVTWSGTTAPNSGVYKAPATTPPGTATITATSVADPTESASATITIVTAMPPGLTSVSPPTGALGAASLEVYLSGSNFICTTAVLVSTNNGVNNIPLPVSSLSSLSSTTFLVNLPDSILSTIPTSGNTTTLTFSVEQQGSTTPVSCPSCQLVLSPVRPAIVASSPDSIQQPSGGTFSVTLDGGYFGTTNTAAGFSGNPVVQVQVNGNTISAPQFSNSDRELLLNVPATALGSTPSPGLYPITITNTVSCPPSGTPACGTGSPNGSIAATNLAVQPAATPTPLGGSPITVGTAPSSVAINTATGIAVIANQGVQKTGRLGHDITLVDLTKSPPVAVGFICTEAVGAVLLPPTTEPTCPGAGPSEPPGPASVAVDNLRNLALVANSGNNTLAVVDLSGTHCTPPGSVPCVTALLSFPSADPSGNPFPLTPQAVGINPVSGLALVAFSTNLSGSGPGGSNAGAILDMNQLQTTMGSVSLPPAALNVVNLNNGVNPHIAVSPRLNWAIATPGGAGSLSIVDLGRQTKNSISGITCSSGVATITTNATVGLFASQPVLISGVNPSDNGIFSVASVSNTTFTFAQKSCASAGSGGTATYALPVATLATNLNVRGVSINDETQKALLVDPTSGVPAFVFNILDQTSRLVNGVPQFNNVATALNPLANVGVIINSSSNQAFLVDPVTPTVLSSPFSTGTSSPVDVAIDPAANTAVIVNSGSPGSVSLFTLGALRSAPQIVQSSFSPGGPSQSSPRVTINSSLGSAAIPVDQNITLIGSFSTGSKPRLDGDPTPFTSVNITNGGRIMTATLSGTTLANNGPRLYALDVVDTSSRISNAAPLQVIQAVNLVTGTGTGPGNCGNPSPQGVAIDAVHNVALVTEPGCNDVAMVSLSASTTFAVGTGFDATPELPVGTNPLGVAVYPQAGLAVAANAGSSNISIVDIVNDGVPQTVTTTTPFPTGVAIDLGTGNAVVTASGASVVDVFPVSASTTAPTPSTIGVQSGPTGLAIDQRNHIAVVANSSSNTASIVNLTSNATTNTSNPITFPQGVAFDPISGNFLITSGASNQVILFNPITLTTTPIRVGIGPSSIAYNFESGTLVTANNLSGTMTVVDFIDQTVRGVFSLPSSTQFAVDIHPQTNLAVVADPADNQLWLVPLPH